MMKNLFQVIKSALAFALMLLGIAASFSRAATESPLIDRERASAMVKAFSGGNPTGFKPFLKELAGHKDYTRFSPVIDLYLKEKPLSAAQQQAIYRLLGIYTNIKYSEQALQTLRELVSIPTFNVETVPQHENPHMIKLGKALEKIAGDFGLPFRNVDNRVFEVTLPGRSEEVIALHAHADVVPVNKSLWVLEDGTKLDPFTLTIIGDRMYGRGAEDDKNGIVVALYAMKVIKEEKLPLLRTFRLLVDTTEETSGTAMPYYLERNPTPAYNLALDGSYPVVIAEKGYGVVMADFPVRKGAGTGAEIVALTGGLATNQIPRASTAKVVTKQPAQLKAKVDALAKKYIAGNGKNFSINTAVEKEELLLSVEGVSAHSSEPSSGINPVSRMLGFIALLDEELEMKDNHITDAAHYAAENWGLDYYGNKLGIAFKHDFMGPMTAALTFIDLNESRLQVAVNLRVPEGKPLERLQSEIEGKLSAWQKERKVAVTMDYDLGEPMYRNPEGIWVNTLLDVATENLGIERKFGASSGGTSIHDLPNGVQFGLSLPDAKYTGHNANEFKTLEQFYLDLRIVTEAVIRLGNLEKL